MSLSCVTLSSRRTVSLVELRLSSTYGGLLEGAPTGRVNDRIIKGRLRVAEDAYPGWPVHLIPPERTGRGGTTRVGEPIEELPPVACVGMFHSGETDPAHRSGWYFSALVVVWFQPTADPPSDAHAPAALRGLAWEELARDFED
ncbi:hypothetical protein CP967_24955 [Streptomyces nitrosporeus]|uniref:Uncharacterized protein n=1 Tax=Streptomyces nitrosporeus TaxID=28894 RepID=A0A5J6FEQ2_9ACTN|nr:hypothetical protein [Streptomyces nitrosporeus]QEU74802.1 hypothetical protein CP967_24955 [Streptomyces nitrosporeus]GGY85887.1 hypothetical protein GCM10010327_15870 [Streptomyces nitrosporeus]